MEQEELIEKEVKKVTGYEFKNKKLLIQAFTRKSYSEENGGVNNEVLEFIGDESLDMCFTKLLIKKYEDLSDGYFKVKVFNNEAKLSQLKQNLVCKTSLSQIIKKVGLNKYLIMGNGDIKDHKEEEISVMEDLFEAIIGAITIDSNFNYDLIEKVVYKLLNLEKHFKDDFSSIDLKDYISLIQEWNQKQHKKLPEYSSFEKDGFYFVSLTLKVPGQEVTFNDFGNSINEAKNRVCKEAYEYISDNNLLWNIKQELKKPLTLGNAINQLQEFAQKKYISMPIYEAHLNMDEDKDIHQWECTCKVESEDLKKIVHSNSAKLAKKYLAYLMVCDLCDLDNEYGKEDYDMFFNSDYDYYVIY